MKKPSKIHYKLCPKKPETHLFEIQCIIPAQVLPLTSNSTSQGTLTQKFRLQLPAWIPGSYLIRDFAKYLVTIEAACDGKAISLNMVDKNTWECEGVSRSLKAPLIVNYQVYAFDLTPRGAYLDNTQAFFNGSRLFILPLGFEKSECLLEILPPEDLQYQSWKVATTLTPGQTNNNNKNINCIDSKGFGLYQSSNYDQLIDHPVLIGNFERYPFKAINIPHDLIITKKYPGDFDMKRVLEDLKKLCEYHIEFFGQAPFTHYQFMLTLFRGGFGGLEHQNSSCLQASPQQLPFSYDPEMSDNYRALLSLFSHEYFHAWNVKSIRPKAFAPYDLNKENYTRLLWVFEGITSYYDELALVRSGLIKIDSYLELLSQLITRVYGTPGRFKQSLEQSSFEAWTKFYQPYENSVNTSISYYTKGALVGLALDLTLRKFSQNQYSLDTVMQAFWEQFGSSNLPVPEDGFEKLASKVTGMNLEDFFNKALRSTEDLEFEELFDACGIEMLWQNKYSMDDVGGRLTGMSSEVLARRPLLEIKLKAPAHTQQAEIASVIEGSTVEASGLAPNDVIIAVNNIKVDRNTLEATIANYTVGDEVLIHVFRRDELMSFKVQLQSCRLKNCVVKRLYYPALEQKQALESWLHQEWKEE